jgi:hypothetical protein
MEPLRLQDTIYNEFSNNILKSLIILKKKLKKKTLSKYDLNEIEIFFLIVSVQSFRSLLLFTLYFFQSKEKKKF